MLVQKLFETWDLVPVNKKKCRRLKEQTKETRKSGKKAENKYLIEYYLTLFDFACVN